MCHDSVMLLGGCAALRCYSFARVLFSPRQLARIIVLESSTLTMKSNAVVLGLLMILAAASRAAAQESLEFTLEEAEAPAKPQKGKAAAAPSVDTKAAI